MRYPTCGRYSQLYIYLLLKCHFCFSVALIDLGGETSYYIYLASVEYVTDAGQTGETHTEQGVECVHIVHADGEHVSIQKALFRRHQVRYRSTLNDQNEFSVNSLITFPFDIWSFCFAALTDTTHRWVCSRRNSLICYKNRRTAVLT